MSEPRPNRKPFVISKEVVWRAYKSVKANRGAPGIDDQSIADFEADLKANLYKLWNRMSSGSYFPQPVRAVPIPKRDGKGSRMLGVPTVAEGSPRPSWPCAWSRRWSLCSTPTPMGTGPVGRRWTRSGCAGSAVGERIGYRPYIGELGGPRRRVCARNTAALGPRSSGATTFSTPSSRPPSGAWPCSSAVSMPTPPAPSPRACRSRCWPDWWTSH